MIVIGLTGNIGSGKSTVARRLKDLGAQIIDADLVAREVVLPGTPALQEIADCFGAEFLDSTGNLDRKKMGAKVFADPQAMEKLNNITHPKIKGEVYRQIQLCQKENKNGAGPRVLVIDAPLLVEVGLEQSVNEVWMVKIDQDIQIARLTQRDGVTPEEALSRIAAQLPQDEKLKFATRVIENSGDKNETIRQVNRHWENMMKEHFRETDGI
ncbi:MAG: dephospho-CoA kinase [Desulfotomaculaceae bacterium]|nr:dephospho-CoA kinase [Desulfotomaculaceae bacterium]